MSVERNNPTLPIRVFADAIIIWSLKNRGLKSPRLFNFPSFRRPLSNELRVMSYEPFMVFCSFVSEKLIAHRSLLKAQSYTFSHRGGDAQRGRGGLPSQSSFIIVFLARVWIRSWCRLRIWSRFRIGRGFGFCVGTFAR